MEKKKQVMGASILFLAIVVINVGAQFLDLSGLPLYMNILLAQGLIVIPAIIYLIVTKQNFFEAIRLRKMNIWSVLLLIPVVYLLEPLLVCINAFSMAFSTNVIANTMQDITDMMPYIAGLSLMALLPALVEELTFRGVMMNSFHRDSNPWPAIIFSAICFGCMHMNFNQITYALVLGILMGIIVEATGSILSTVIVHFIYNGTSTTLLYLMPKVMAWSNSVLEESGMSQQELDQAMNMGDAASSVEAGQMLMVAGVMIFPALMGLALAALLVYLIAYLNKRHYILKGMFTKKTPEQKEAMAADKVRIMNVFLGIAIGLCAAMAILVEVLQRIKN